MRLAGRRLRNRHGAADGGHSFGIEFRIAAGAIERLTKEWCAAAIDPKTR